MGSGEGSRVASSESRPVAGDFGGDADTFDDNPGLFVVGLGFALRLVAFSVAAGMAAAWLLGRLREVTGGG